jgi:DNA-binding NarL/FixJ family response regulator
VSKKRPRIEKLQPPTASTDRSDPGYWRQRIRKSTYTYAGESRVAASWHIKFQINGRRRTITLKSADLDAAALEARDAYRNAMIGSSNGGLQLSSRGEVEDAVRMSAAYWQSRLLRRKYLELLRQDFATEWSVVIDYGKLRRLFPLGTMNQGEAAMRAAERFRVVAQQGWRQADLQFEQEFSVALFWNPNPLIYTYSTMLTIPASLAAEIPERGAACAIIVEPEEGVQRALRRWLSCQVGFSLRVLASDGANLNALVQRNRPTIVLVNISQSGESGSDMLNRERDILADIPVYTYGVFEDSDSIFASVSNISGGFILRRRPPDRLLDPISGSPIKSLTADRVQRKVRRYFNRLIEGGEGVADSTDEPSLTIREHEVMVFMAQGLQDKEIANKLNISTWTVNSHARHIYQKFEVHGRTEAVVKFLEMEKGN